VTQSDEWRDTWRGVTIENGQVPSPNNIEWYFLCHSMSFLLDFLGHSIAFGEGWRYWYIIGLFCKRAPWKRRYSTKETLTRIRCPRKSNKNYSMSFLFLLWHLERGNDREWPSSLSKWHRMAKTNDIEGSFYEWQMT